MNNILQKGIKKYIKSTIIENFHDKDRIDDEKLKDSINYNLWINDSIEDQIEELPKRNWLFFTGIFVFYLTFIFVLSRVIKN